MKKLIVALLLFCSVLVTNAQVNIKPETARYFLEADDERWLLRKKDSLQTVALENLHYQNFLMGEIVRNYQDEEELYNLQWNLLVDQHNALVDENDSLNDKLTRRKRLEVIGIGILILLLIFL